MLKQETAVFNLAPEPAQMATYAVLRRGEKAWLREFTQVPQSSNRGEIKSNVWEKGQPTKGVCKLELKQSTKIAFESRLEACLQIFFFSRHAA